MSFLTELMGNMKEGATKSIIAILLSIIVFVCSYFFAYRQGSDKAKYDNLMSYEKKRSEINDKMNNLKGSLDAEYKNKIKNIDLEVKNYSS